MELFEIAFKDQYRFDKRLQRRGSNVLADLAKKMGATLRFIEFMPSMKVCGLETPLFLLPL